MDPTSSSAMDPPIAGGSGKAKAGRSRAACEGCRANKQRCDGASRVPCRRCELYGTPCIYPGPNKPHVTAKVAASLSSGSRMTVPKMNPVAPGTGTKKDEVKDALKDITERLARIEAGLSEDRNHHLSFPTASTSYLRPSSDSFSEPILDPPIDSNPLQMVDQSLNTVEDTERGEWMDDADSPISGSGRAVLNDALVRGLVTPDDCEAAFSFFYTRIQPWLLILGEPRDRIPLAMRARHPLLFHTILLVTNYFNTSSSDRAKEVYRGLTGIVNELLAQQILCPDPAYFNSDYIRALNLLLTYKPVQHACYEARGVTDPGRIEQASKINSLSSVMIHSLIYSTSVHIRLLAAPRRFLDAHKQGRITIELFEDLRLWYWVVTTDAHGSLQTGRPGATNPNEALQTTRLFAECDERKGDVRRAALLEAYAIIQNPANHPSSVRLNDLSRVNKELDGWERYWAPLLMKAQSSGDTLAYSTLIFRHFITTTINSAVFTRWTQQRKISLAAGGIVRPILREEDWEHLQRAVEAAEQSVLCVSMDARKGGDLLRRCEWPEEIREGFWEELQVDPVVVEDFRVSIDTVTCVMFVYPLILLSRMANAGLISCDLRCRRKEYDAGASLEQAPRALQTGQKLPRLLELGAAFLDAFAPRNQHPARKHAVLLQMIIRVGVVKDIHASSYSESSHSESSPSGTGHPATPIYSSPAAQQPSLSTWLWDTSAPNLPLNSNNRIQLPFVPPPASRENNHFAGGVVQPGDGIIHPGVDPGVALASLLNEFDPYLFSEFEANNGYGGSLDPFTNDATGSINFNAMAGVDMGIGLGVRSQSGIGGMEWDPVGMKFV